MNLRKWSENYVHKLSENYFCTFCISKTYLLIVGFDGTDIPKIILGHFPKI